MHVHVLYASYIDRMLDFERDAIHVGSMLDFCARDALDCMMELGNAIHVLCAFVRDAIKVGTMIEFFVRNGRDAITEVGNPIYVLLIYLQS